MTALALSIERRRSWLAGALTVTRRELRDILRDWRIVIPIIFLTLFFPVLMNFTVGVARNFLLQYGGANVVISERLMPFFMMVVGFFPISFSLVVALETFVGERERKSIEALLCTPLSNGQLYLGKMLAAMLPPLGAAYLGIAVYMASLSVLRGWSVPPLVLFQIVVLTTCEGVVMVSGAVVVSSHTTSTRAANLLASFIIIPMALLVQAESAAMFLADYDVLWGFVAVLIVVDLILVRMGLQLFDREQLLGREFDTIDLKEKWRTFMRFFKQVDPEGAAERWTLWRVYRRDLPAIARRAAPALRAVLLVTGLGLLGGWVLAQRQQVDVRFDANAVSLTSQYILANNLRVVLASSLVGIFTFGVFPAVVPLLNSALIAFVVTRAVAAGHDPLALLAAGILPHGVFEVTAVWLAATLALRLGAAVIARPPKMTMGEGWLLALADYLKALVFVVVPLLVLAAVVEAHVTPLLLSAALGR